MGGCAGVPFGSLPRAATSLTGHEFVVEEGGVYAICTLDFTTDLASIDAASVRFKVFITSFKQKMRVKLSE